MPVDYMLNWAYEIEEWEDGIKKKKGGNVLFLCFYDTVSGLTSESFALY